MRTPPFGGDASPGCSRNAQAERAARGATGRYSRRHGRRLLRPRSSSVSSRGRRSLGALRSRHRRDRGHVLAAAGPRALPRLGHRARGRSEPGARLPQLPARAGRDPDPRPPRRSAAGRRAEGRRLGRGRPLGGGVLARRRRRVRPRCEAGQRDRGARGRDRGGAHRIRGLAARAALTSDPRARGHAAGRAGADRARARRPLDGRRSRLPFRRRARARDALPDGRAPDAAGRRGAAPGRPLRPPPRHGRRPARAERAALVPPRGLRRPEVAELGARGVSRAHVLLRRGQRRERLLARAGREAGLDELGDPGRDDAEGERRVGGDPAVRDRALGAVYAPDARHPRPRPEPQPTGT